LKSSRIIFSGDIAGPGVAGERIIIEGRIFEPARATFTKDVLVETWQANAAAATIIRLDKRDKALDQGFVAGRGPDGFRHRTLHDPHHQTGSVAVARAAR